MPKVLRAEVDRPTYRFWLLAAFLTLVFLLGGSSRADVASLMFLRPVAAFVLVVGLYSLTRAHLQAYRFTFAIMIAVCALILLHLIPLPPGLWHLLPGRGLVADIDRALGATGQWRPLSLAPAATLNALLTMMPPLAVLVLAVQLRAHEHQYLAPVLVIITAITCAAGLLQVTGLHAIELYSGEGDGVVVPKGLFANQNHQAAFLAISIPLIVALGRSKIPRSETLPVRWFATAFSILVVLAVIVATQSRAGIILAAAALISVRFVARQQDGALHQRRSANPNAKLQYRPLLIGGLLFGAVSMALLLERTQVFSRIARGSPLDDFRFQIWRPIVAIVPAYMPFGSGIGTFVQVYQVHEPVGLLRAEYLNHAHNDLLEAALTGGVPALLLIVVAALGWGRRAFAVGRCDVAVTNRLTGSARLDRLGAVAIFLLALASLTDYPLRTPSLACLLVLAAVWMQIVPTATADRSPRKEK